MVLYEVTLQVESDIAERVEQYMRHTHIPHIFKTGCFGRIQFDRAGSGRFRTSYQAARQEDLDRYLAEHAPELRAEFQSEFPQGVTLAREVWSQVEVWRAIFSQ